MLASMACTVVLDGFLAMKSRVTSLRDFGAVCTGIMPPPGVVLRTPVGVVMPPVTEMVSAAGAVRVAGPGAEWAGGAARCAWLVAGVAAGVAARPPGQNVQTPVQAMMVPEIMSRRRGMVGDRMTGPPGGEASGRIRPAPGRSAE
ncbi:hypothetical protein GCM10023158_26510 [Gluconacetobacter tumulicola]